METTKKKKQVYKSMIEFEKEFLPNSLKRRLSEVPTDSRALGMSLARESLDAIRTRLVK
jgi:hypothetical protein